MSQLQVTQKFMVEAKSILQDLIGHMEKLRSSKSFSSLLTLRKMNKLSNQLAGAAFVIEYHHIAQVSELIEEITHLVIGKKDEELITEGIKCFDNAIETLGYYIDNLKNDGVSIDVSLIKNLTSYIDKLGGARKRLTQTEIDKLLGRNSRKTKK